MFARTPRLLLRPGWVEDAAALADAHDHAVIVSAGGNIPSFQSSDQAAAFLALPHDPARPRLLMFERTPTPRLVGGIGLTERPGGATLDYWVRPDRRGRGLATEAGRAVVAIADMLGLPRLHAGHCMDNPASARVLEKLGFRPTGEIGLASAVGRAGDGPSRCMIRHAAPTREATPLAA